MITTKKCCNCAQNERKPGQTYCKDCWQEKYGGKYTKNRQKLTSRVEELEDRVKDLETFIHLLE